MMSLSGAEAGLRVAVAVGAWVVVSPRTREAGRVGTDAGGGPCAPVDLEALLRGWIVFGEWETRSQLRVRVGEAGVGVRRGDREK